MQRPQTKEYPEGKIVFREGDRGDVVYLIKEGEVELSKVKDTEKIILATLKENSIFGEMALLDSKPRSATARASKNTVCYIISRDTFEKKLSEMDPLMRGIFRVLSESLRRMTSKYPYEDF